VIWLEGAIEGDDTDGHIDDIARFVAPGCVVCAVEPDPGDPNHASLEACRRELECATDAQGRPIRVVELPMPPPLEAFGDRIPASYANFYIANGAVLAPTFDAASDAQALSLLGKLFPRHAVHAIPSRALVRGLGSVHCLTQQEPAGTEE
jgi:agmatine deiminase